MPKVSVIVTDDQHAAYKTTASAAGHKSVAAWMRQLCDAEAKPDSKTAEWGAHLAGDANYHNKGDDTSAKDES